MFRCQSDIPGTHGKTVIFPDSGASDNPKVKIKIFRHPTDDDQLLGVLLTEIGTRGLKYVEQFCHHRGNPLEMPRSGGAFQKRRHLSHIYTSLIPPGGT